MIVGRSLTSGIRLDKASTRTVFLPPTLTLIFKATFARYCLLILKTCFVKQHCETIPRSVSQILFKSPSWIVKNSDQWDRYHYTEVWMQAKPRIDNHTHSQYKHWTFTIIIIRILQIVYVPYSEPLLSGRMTINRSSSFFSFCTSWKRDFNTLSTWSVRAPVTGSTGLGLNRYTGKYSSVFVHILANMSITSTQTEVFRYIPFPILCTSVRVLNKTR